MKEKILKILGDIRPEFDFNESDNFIDDGLLDSFDIVTLVSELDSEFSISINGEDISSENFATLTTIENLLKVYI